MATQDGWVIVESSDKTWSTGEGNDKPLQYSSLENLMNSKRRQKDMTLKDELSRSVGAQYATGKEWRNNSRKNEVAKSFQSCLTLCNPIDGSPPGSSVPGILQARMKRWSEKVKTMPVVDVTGDGSKVQCCKEQHCLGTWNVRSMNQGNLEVVKQEMTRVNVNIL